MICALKDFEQGCIRSIEELLKLHFQSLKTAFDPQKHIFKAFWLKLAVKGMFGMKNLFVKPFSEFIP